MARIKSKRTALQMLSCKFSGMGKHSPLEPLGAEDMCNFRILPNGTLKVRSGYTRIKHFSSDEKVRGVWEGVLDDIYYFFVVVGDTVYRLVGEELSETNVGTITNGNGTVRFCVYENMLYLLDGIKIWTFSSTSPKFTELEPYVPLYGYQWHPASYGEINEQINLLTPQLRVHYYNSTDTDTFILPFYSSSVDVVFVNGRKTTEYSFTPGSNKVVFTSAVHPMTVEIGFTIMIDDDLRNEILASQIAYIYSRNGINQLMLSSNSGRLFCARSVTSEMITHCHVSHPKASPLYFCTDDVFFLGDFMHPITAFCPLYETLLVFTSDRIWNLSFEKEGIQATLSMRDMGCASSHGVIPYESGVLAAMNGGIYYLTASPARPEDLFPERISLGIDDKFPTSFTDNVEFLRNFADGEIWMRDPTDTDGNIWVWNNECKDWYRFTGIDATFFFKKSGNIGFASGSDLFLFGRAESTDNGSPIDAHYKSAYIDFGDPSSIRRSLRAMLYASPSKSDAHVLLETEQGERSYQFKTPSYAKKLQLHDIRMHTHRYRFLRFTLSTAASHPIEFYRLDIYSKP